MMKERIQNLTKAMPAGFEAALITTPVNRFYFLGLDTGDAGTLLVLQGKAYFIIDSRYIEIARRVVTAAEVLLEDKAPLQLAELVRSHGVHSVYMESKETIAYADKVRDALPKEVALDRTGTLSDTVDALRTVKSDEEIDAMRRAQVITDACFTHIQGMLKPGVREIDLALEMEMFMRKNGAGKLAFDTILVAGTKTSLPHGVPDANVLKDGDFVTMDFGANVDGYCTDMTRTVALGHVSDEQKKVYDTVLKAQLAACEGAKAGMRGCDVDKIARDIIYGAGYEGCFGHGLGHAVGIEIHEDPRYSPTCTTV
ncbi:MAG: aminopeptidase P family protein, partial [Ruthenibacterium sp.]